MLLLWLSLAGAGEEPETIDDSPPWGPSHSTYLAPYASEGLEGYHRYQRIANTGLPLYLGGLTLTAYSIYALEMNVMAPANAFVTGGIGLAVAWGGAGALGWGSYSAITRLYAGQSARPPVLAGKISLGLLGVSAASYVSTIILIPSVGAAPTPLFTFSLAMTTGILAGVPGLVQTAINPGKARRIANEGWAVFPYRGRDSYGVAVARRF